VSGKGPRTVAALGAPLDVSRGLLACLPRSRLPPSSCVPEPRVACHAKHAQSPQRVAPASCTASASKAASETVRASSSQGAPLSCSLLCTSLAPKRTAAAGMAAVAAWLRCRCLPAACAGAGVRRHARRPMLLPQDPACRQVPGALPPMLARLTRFPLASCLEISAILSHSARFARE
jgi:hypothetical protein